MFEHLRFCSNGFSVVVRRFNSVLLHDGFVGDSRPARVGFTAKQCVYLSVIFGPPGFTSD